MGCWLTAESSMGQRCSLQLDLTLFVCLFLRMFELSRLTFEAPSWLLHHRHPEEAAPLPAPFIYFPRAPFFFSPLLLLPTPHDPATCVLAVIPSALIASQQDGAGVSDGVKAETRRGKSHGGVWNLTSKCGICRQTKFSHCP